MANRSSLNPPGRSDGDDNPAAAPGAGARLVGEMELGAFSALYLLAGGR